MEHLCIRYEFYGVVIGSMLRQAFRCLLREHFKKLVVLSGYDLFDRADLLFLVLLFSKLLRICVRC